MKRYLLGTAFAVATPMAAAAQDCGEVSIAEMNWASAQRQKSNSEAEHSRVWRWRTAVR